jgi:hypothetical protein
MAFGLGRWMVNPSSPLPAVWHPKAVWLPKARFHPLSGDALRSEDGTLCLPLFRNIQLKVDSLTSIDWEHPFPTQERTSTLYLTGLELVGRLLLGASEVTSPGFEAACAILDSFLRYLAEPAKRKRAFTIHSADHAAASRTEIFVRFSQFCSGAGHYPPLLERVLRELERHAEWLLDPANRKRNNHGLMLDRALVLASAQLETVVPEASRWAITALERTTTLANELLDEDGYSNENTVGYHNFNIVLLQEISSIAERNGLDLVASARLKHKVELATTALQHCIWQDGSVPPIGDSYVFPSRHRSINRSKWFKDSHFIVVKSDDLYLSLICGHRGYSHKHVDDSSITLRYLGRDIIVDGGSYNYDESDPMRKHLRSARGHSGIYLDGADEALPPSPTRAYPFSARVVGLVETDRAVRAVCTYTFQHAWGAVSTAVRSIAVIWPGEIVVADRVITEVPVSVRQSFLFGPEMARVSGPPAHDFLGDGVVDVALRHISASISDWFRGESGEVMRGWYSSAPNQAVAVTGVDFRQCGADLRFLTVLNVASKDSLAEPRWREVLGEDPWTCPAMPCPVPG